MPWAYSYTQLRKAADLTPTGWHVLRTIAYTRWDVNESARKAIRDLKLPDASVLTVLDMKGLAHYNPAADTFCVTRLGAGLGRDFADPAANLIASILVGGTAGLRWKHTRTQLDAPRLKVLEDTKLIYARVDGTDEPQPIEELLATPGVRDRTYLFVTRDGRDYSADSSLSRS